MTEEREIDISGELLSASSLLKCSQIWDEVKAESRKPILVSHMGGRGPGTGPSSSYSQEYRSNTGLEV